MASPRRTSPASRRYAWRSTRASSVEAAQQPVGAAPGVSREREARGEGPGALLQALDAEEFAVQRAGIETDRPQAGRRPAGRERTGTA